MQPNDKKPSPTDFNLSAKRIEYFEITPEIKGLGSKLLLISLLPAIVATVALAKTVANTLALFFTAFLISYMFVSAAGREMQRRMEIKWKNGFPEQPDYKQYLEYKKALADYENKLNAPLNEYVKLWREGRIEKSQKILERWESQRETIYKIRAIFQYCPEIFFPYPFDEILEAADVYEKHCVFFKKEGLKYAKELKNELCFFGGGDSFDEQIWRMNKMLKMMTENPEIKISLFKQCLELREKYHENKNTMFLTNDDGRPGVDPALLRR